MNCFLNAVICATIWPLVRAQVSITDPASKNSSVNEGGRLTILCTTLLGGTVDWLHNDRPIGLSLDSTRYIVGTETVQGQSRHSLTLNDVRMQDAGTFTCRQTFADDRNVNVTRLYALQMIEPDEETLTLKAGDNMTLACLADNAAVVVWYRSNQLISAPDERDDVIVERNVFTNRQTAQLLRLHVTSKDSGDYQCRDHTKHLSPSRVLHVHVASTAELAASCYQRLTSYGLYLAATPLIAVTSTFRLVRTQ